MTASRRIWGELCRSFIAKPRRDGKATRINLTKTGKRAFQNSEGPSRCDTEDL